MRDWEQYVRQRLLESGLPLEHQAEIVEELAQHLEAAYEDALGGGVSEKARNLKSGGLFHLRPSQ